MGKASFLDTPLCVCYTLAHFFRINIVMDATATYLNFVDLFMVIVIVAIARSGARKGVIAEIFSLLGIACVTFVALHYCVRFAQTLRVLFFGENASTEFLAFNILGILVFVIFIVINKGWVLILKIKFPEKIDRYGGIGLSLARSYFICGLIFFALLLSNHKYITPEARQAVSCHVFRYVAVDLYKSMHSNLIEPFFPNEKFSEEACHLVVKKKKKRK